MGSLLSKEEANAEAVVTFGPLNIMERPQNFLQCYRKVLCCIWNNEVNLI
jgi:hypothetical protein